MIIEGLGPTPNIGWQYSTNGGLSWEFGGVNDFTGTAELELDELDVTSGTLIVRQIDASGNVSKASNALAYAFDDVKPTGTLSLLRIEGAPDWDTVAAGDIQDGGFTLTGIDLGSADPTIQMRVIDNAGNVGDQRHWTVDGPYEAGLVSVRMTPAGLRIDSTVAGVIKISNSVVTSNHESGGAIAGYVTVGEQTGPVSGKLTVTPDGGQPIADSSGASFQFGAFGYDTLSGNYLWGFDGNDDLHGTTGDDYLSGGIGNDTIYSEGGNDTIVGGKDGDEIYLSRGEGVATLVYEEGDTRVGRFDSGNQHWVSPQLDHHAGRS